MLWFLAAAGAVEPSEEVFVWGNPFARWQRRWFVEAEVQYLEPQVVFGTVNHELSLASVQIRAVLDCEIDFVLGPEAREVSCTIEDFGLVARPRYNLATNDAVLAEIDDTLTGKVVQLQVKADGQVPNLDLEGIPTRNSRDRKRVEQLRVLMSRVVLPFHIEVTETPRDGAQWHEYNSALFLLPTATTPAGVLSPSSVKTGAFTGGCTTGSVGASTIAHYLNLLGKDQMVLQSIGEATLTCPGRSGVLSWNADQVASESSAQRDLLAMDLHGVAIIDPDTGILTERVWAVTGELTASSPNAVYDLRYHHTGRFRMLGQDEQVHIGPSWVARSLPCEDASRRPCIGPPDTRPEWRPLAP
jgi:hypothetical protein